jgi:type II secretory pathway predicted ATPase ExeA
MDLSKRCKDHWGFSPFLTPFGKTIEAADGLFVWQEFETAVERVVDAIEHRKFMVLSGVACSAKSTCWNEARRQMTERTSVWHHCQPWGLAVRDYNEVNLYRCIKDAIMPFDGSRETAFRRDREARGRQVRDLLEQRNEKREPVCLAINDAHECRSEFLRMVKRLWDELYGFDRLIAIVLIGQPGLATMCSSIQEINERSEVVRMPGLGAALEEYLHHECGRCGAKEFPFDESAVAELAKLSSKNWLTARDHPLIVNNVVSRALDLAWRTKASAVVGDHISEAMRDGRKDRDAGIIQD